MTKKKCPPINLEKLGNGGYCLSYLGYDDCYYKQLYYLYTEKEARDRFWEYLQGQGISGS